MKNKQFDEEVFRVAAETIEALALMFLIPEEDAPEIPGPTEAAFVDFDGPFGGFLAVSVSQCLLLDLAANMLGEEDSSLCGIEQQYDALKELTNVICGNLLPALAGTEAVFNVGTPVVTGDDLAPPDIQRRTLIGESRLFLDEGVVQVCLYVDERAAVAGEPASTALSEQAQ